MILLLNRLQQLSTKNKQEPAYKYRISKSLGYFKTRKFHALSYLAALMQRTLWPKISCALKVFSLRFEDILFSKGAKINVRQYLHSCICSKICMNQIFSFFSIQYRISKTLGYRV
jgi:hypothetical protein